MDEMEMVKLLRRFLAQDLPGDVTLIYVPIEKSAYGWRITYEVHFTESACDIPPTESITLEKYEIGKLIIYAGYGPVTKSLVVGEPKKGK